MGLHELDRGGFLGNSKFYVQLNISWNVIYQRAREHSANVSRHCKGNLEDPDSKIFKIFKLSHFFRLKSSRFSIYLQITKQYNPKISFQFLVSWLTQTNFICKSLTLAFVNRSKNIIYDVAFYQSSTELKSV